MKDIALQRPAVFCALVLLAVWGFFGKSMPFICNDGSRLATIESLATRGTFEISDSMFIETCDKVRIPPHGEGGRYFSDKPPFLSILGAAIYKVLRAGGVDLRTDLRFVYRVLTLLLVVFPALGILYFMSLYFTARAVPLEHRLWIYLLAIFGTLVLPYSLVINNHVPAAALLLGSFVFLEKRALGLSGLCLGLAISADLSAAIFGLAFGLYLFFQKGRHKFEILRFAFFLALPISATFLIMRFNTGSWRPYVVQPGAYLYEGSVVPRSVVFGGAETGLLPLRSYLLFLWHSLLGYRGVFSHSIGLVFGFSALLKMYERKDEKRVALLILIPVGLLAAFITFQMPISFGGSSYGSRYMILWMPLVVLFGYRVFERQGVQWWMKAVVGVSILTSAAGILSPWLIHKWNPLELDTFDFISVFESTNNPYKLYEAAFRPYESEMEELQTKRDSPSFLRLAFIHYVNHRPAEALGYLQLMGERDSSQMDWHCYTAQIFSKKGIGLTDLMQRNLVGCPAKLWEKLNAKN